MARSARPNRSNNQDDLAWRVIGLLNIYRLLVPMVLILLLFFNAPNRSVGTALPGLFLGISVAYFAFALVCIQPIQKRWPGEITDFQPIWTTPVNGLVPKPVDNKKPAARLPKAKTAAATPATSGLSWPAGRGRFFLVGCWRSFSISARSFIR